MQLEKGKYRGRWLHQRGDGNGSPSLESTNCSLKYHHASEGGIPLSQKLRTKMSYASLLDLEFNEGSIVKMVFAIKGNGCKNEYEVFNLKVLAQQNGCSFSFRLQIRLCGGSHLQVKPLGTANVASGNKGEPPVWAMI